VVRCTAAADRRSKESAVRIATVCLSALVALWSVAPGIDLFAIEAVRGKSYELTREHGPWMIMVGSFRNVPKDRREEGLTAEEAAQELVYELRAAGIPAYTYAQGAVVEKIHTVDRQGRDDERIFAAQRDMVCVLAGNWKEIDDKEGQKALAAIKKYHPKFMKQEKSGAIFRETPGRKGPLGGAFMTINPLLTPEEVAQRKLDPELARINSNSMFSLTNCKKKYSVQVATFTGKQSMQVAAAQFDRKLQDRNSYSLNHAGEDAMQLAKYLREQKVEAYVHHDWYQSIVTVGGFDSLSDPGIVQAARQFGPQYREDPENPRQQKLLPYTIMVKTGDKPTDFPVVWVFDMQPQLVRTSDGRPEQFKSER
jgi:hypothetical protein